MVETKKKSSIKQAAAGMDRATMISGKQSLITDKFGHSMPSVKHVLTAGANGPILLQDYQYLNMQTAFDRERIPERAVHAKGFGAHGEFCVTDTKFARRCKAKMFNTTGKTTPVFVRFSAVNFERGFPDTIRDPRGFAIKFYSQDPGEGIMDWVFLNFPVFFVRDPMKGPSTIHVCKRDPQSGLRREQNSTANTAFWDFMSRNPESVHTLMFMFGDRGLPQSYRHMNGYSGHSYKVLNDNGEISFAKFSLKSHQTVKNLNSEKDGHKIAGENPDYYNRDLFESIQNGNYPKWDVVYQVMSLEDAKNFRHEFGHDAFEITKVWPKNRFPEEKFGEIVLNRNVDNYHAEVEQAAFGPGNLVSGMEINPHDRLFQARAFFYQDTQLHRLGPNYHQLPINNGSINGPEKAVKVFNRTLRDGPMNVSRNFGSLPPYYQASDESLAEREEPRMDDTMLREPVEFVRRDVYDETVSEDVDFVQPRKLWQKVWDDGQRERFIKDVAGNLCTVNQKPVLHNVISLFFRIDESLGRGIEEQLKSQTQ